MVVAREAGNPSDEGSTPSSSTTSWSPVFGDRVHLFRRALHGGNPKVGLPQFRPGSGTKRARRSCRRAPLRSLAAFRARRGGGQAPYRRRPRSDLPRGGGFGGFDDAGLRAARSAQRRCSRLPVGRAGTSAGSACSSTSASASASASTLGRKRQAAKEEMRTGAFQDALLEQQVRSPRSTGAGCALGAGTHSVEACPRRSCNETRSRSTHAPLCYARRGEDGPGVALRADGPRCRGSAGGESGVRLAWALTTLARGGIVDGR